jgi:hypothetical protein
MFTKGPPLQNTFECSTLHWRKGVFDEASHNNWCRYFKMGSKGGKVGAWGDVLGSRGSHQRKLD